MDTDGAYRQKLPASHRVREPSHTLALVKPFLSRMGITRVANVTGLDRIGIPTVLVTRPNARSLSVSQGKGFSLGDAKVSGIMEAIELHLAETAALPLRLASYLALSTESAVADVERLPGYLRRFEPEVPILWAAARELSGEPAFVPFDMVHADLTLPLAPVSGFFPLGSNGLASGNSLAEAVAHGLFELVERDSLALFYRMRPEQQLARRLLLTSVDDERCRVLLQRLEDAEMETAVWDITSDIGLPAFFCSIVESEVNPFHRVGQANGFGCHLDAAEALKRALTEAAQSRLTRIAGSRDDIQREDQEALRSETSIRNHQFTLRSHVPERRFEAIASYRHERLEDDIAFIRDRLAECGMEHVYYVDLSARELPVRVVRVVVPGLEGVPDIPGYVPGKRALAVSSETSA